MTTINFKIKASDELLFAYNKHRLLELFSKYNIPSRQFAYGDTAICIAIKPDRVGEIGMRKRVRLSRWGIVSINVDLLNLEIKDPNFPILKSYEKGMDEELSQRLAIQKLGDLDGYILSKTLVKLNKILKIICEIKEPHVFKALDAIQEVETKTVDFDAVFNEEKYMPRDRLGRFCNIKSIQI